MYVTAGAGIRYLPRYDRTSVSSATDKARGMLHFTTLRCCDVTLVATLWFVSVIFLSVDIGRQPLLLDYNRQRLSYDVCAEEFTNNDSVGGLFRPINIARTHSISTWRNGDFEKSVQLRHFCTMTI